ncbi:MAG: class I SAM-dependent methyltransferase [Candidatus Bathyarchaeia archaeon]|jgi:ubiquinone/menaquinone biosynthesis C-methylase UbiE
MHDKLGKLLACPVCSASLSFEGAMCDNRYFNGYFKCPSGHVFQVKEQIGFLKDAKLSEKEFEWKVNVADEKKYLEVRRKYDSYLRDDQKAATRKMMDKLLDHVSRSSQQSDDTVLDAASGMGTFLLPLLDKSSANSLVIGTDIDERPLRGLMNRSLKAGTYDKLSLVVTDAKHLCFKNAVFSTVSSFFGFDNVPETVLALRECARVLRAGGRTFFVSIWYREGSESMRIAEEHNCGQIASEGRLKDALAKSGLVLDQVEEAYSGLWPHNPMDLLPVEGDEYSHVIVSARKPKH